MSPTSRSTRLALLALIRATVAANPARPVRAIVSEQIHDFYDLGLGDGIFGGSTAAFELGYRGHQDDKNLLEEIIRDFVGEITEVDKTAGTGSQEWVSIYWDIDPGTTKLRPYLRLAPHFMDLEAAGYPHGLSVGGFRETQEEAEQFATNVARFMDHLIADWLSHADSPESRPRRSSKLCETEGAGSSE